MEEVDIDGLMTMSMMETFKWELNKAEEFMNFQAGQNSMVNGQMI